jgi:hypothetical protein
VHIVLTKPSLETQLSGGHTYRLGGLTANLRGTRLANVEAELEPVGMQAIGLLSVETAEPTSAEPRVPMRLGHIATVAFGSQTRSR